MLSFSVGFVDAVNRLAHEEVACCVVRMRLVIVVWLPTHPTTHQFIMLFVQQVLHLVLGLNCSLAICREELNKSFTQCFYLCLSIQL